MAADFKSHVLRREEKGVFGIPFKRLLLAGCGGGLVYTLLNIIAPSWALLVALVSALLAVVLTGLRGGIPLWQRLTYRLRGGLLLAASRHPDGLAGQVASLLALPADTVTLEGASVFAPPQSSVPVDLRDWIVYANADDADGLEFVQSPLGEGD